MGALSSDVASCSLGNGKSLSQHKRLQVYENEDQFQATSERTKQTKNEGEREFWTGVVTSSTVYGENLFLVRKIYFSVYDDVIR